MGVCHQWVLEFHEVQDNAGPLRLIIVFQLSLYKILFVWFQRLVVRCAALWSNDTLYDKLRNKVRRIYIVFAAVRDDLSHWSLMPVSEITADDRRLVEGGYEVIVGP